MKKPNPIVLAVAALVGLLQQPLAVADDIDVFVGGANTTQKPNLLIVLDSSSNWSSSLAPDPDIHPTTKQTKFHHEMKALGKVLDALGDCQKVPGVTPATCKPDGSLIGDGLRLGLMMFAETGTNGGYVRSAVRDMNSANRNALKCMLTGQPIVQPTGYTCNSAQSPGLNMSGSDSDNSGSNQPYAKVMFEAFKYFGGYTSPAYAYKDAQPSGAIKDATHFGPRAYAGWGTDSGSDKGSIRRDYQGNNTARSSNKAFGATGGSYNNGAFDNAADTNYNSDFVETCGKNFILFISNGNPGTGGDSGGTSEVTLLSNVGGNTTTIKNAAGAVVHASYGDEFARFLYQTDVSEQPGQQNVTTYTMAVYDEADTNQTSTVEMNKLMDSMATAGGGAAYRATKGADLVEGLLSAINQMMARDSTFVTATLPVNTNAQGEFLNQVFIGTFRPDSNGNPRWWGNVKQYRLACMIGSSEDTSCGVSSTVKLVDNSTPPKVIYSAGTAFIDSNVTSYWTEAGNQFWINSPKGASNTPTYDAPDGEVVEKGGVAQRLRISYSTDRAPRKVFTCASSGSAAAGVVGSCGVSGSALANFNTTGTSPGLAASDASKFFQSSTPIPDEIDLGSKTVYGGTSGLSAANQATEFTRLVDWVRGSDNINPSDERGPGAGVTVRPSIHGDVIHSRPVAIDFGGSHGVVLFYGDNHGHLHAIKGKTDTATGGGSELWSFVAPEFFPKLARLRANLPALLTPVTPGGIDPAPIRKDYFWDGSISAYQDRLTDPANPKVYLYITARRGGRFIYALDVSDPTTPKFLWKIDPNTSGFSNLGQTWSAPAVTKVPGQTDPVMIFGGGYPGDYQNGATDICEDADGSRNHTTAPCDRGRGVYVVNAKTGALIKHISGTGVSARVGASETTVDMDYAIPSDVYFMDSDFDGLSDRLYVGDLGGRVWRMELSSANSNDWKAYLLSALGTTGKVFFRPAVIQQTAYTGVLVGTGDREKPLKTDSTDGFYAIKDTSPAVLLSTSAWASSTAANLCLKNAAGECSSGSETYGWRIPLAQGEKVINSPRVAFGIVNFATNIPKANTASQCFNNGEARSYQLKFESGTGAFASGNLYTTIGTGGLAPTAFVGIVDINGHKKAVIIGGGTGEGSDNVGPTTANTKPMSVPSKRIKRYWYKEKS